MYNVNVDFFDYSLFEIPPGWDLPKKLTYKGKELIWELPERLYHATPLLNEASILKSGLLKSAGGVGIYMYNEKVPLTQMTGRFLQRDLVVFEVSKYGVNQLIADQDDRIDPDWHKTNSDPYPQYQYRCRQERISPEFLRVVYKSNPVEY